MSGSASFTRLQVAMAPRYRIEREEAIACLEQAYAERAGRLYGVKGSLLFTTLHGHPVHPALEEHKPGGSTMSDQLREFLADILDWQQAHASFDSAIADLPASLRGERPEGLPYSVWELVEHIRIAQNDILEFARDPGYKEDKKWPDDYWPATPAPPSAEAWNTSIAGYHGDVEAFKQLIHDPAFDLFAKVPWGSGQTNIREVVLTFDHTAYHVGQIVLVRRLLGAWK